MCVAAPKLPHGFRLMQGKRKKRKGKKIQTHNRKIVDNIIDKLQIIINAAKVTRPMM